MNKACPVLFDYIDFTSFSKLHTDVKTNNCRIYKAGWEKDGDVWVFTIQADRFYVIWYVLLSVLTRSR